jgi:hypothetical protein
MLHTKYKRKPGETSVPQQEYNKIYKTENNPQPSTNLPLKMRENESKEIHTDNTKCSHIISTYQILQLHIPYSASIHDNILDT